MIYTYSDCAQARKCGAHKSRNPLPWSVGHFFLYHSNISRILSYNVKNVVENKTTQNEGLRCCATLASVLFMSDASVSKM